MRRRREHMEILFHSSLHSPHNRAFYTFLAIKPKLMADMDREMMGISIKLKIISNPL
jgi:hypothetical protein